MYNEMENDILKVLFSQEDIARRGAEMGAALTERFQGKKPLFLGVLKGCFVFMSDLIRSCPLKSDLEFIAVKDFYFSPTAKLADLVLPSADWSAYCCSVMP